MVISIFRKMSLNELVLNKNDIALLDYRAPAMNKERRPSSYGQGTDSVNEAVQIGEQRGREADETEKRMRAAGLTQQPVAPPDLIPRNLSEASRGGFIVLEATRALRNRFELGFL